MIYLAVFTVVQFSNRLFAFKCWHGASGVNTYLLKQTFGTVNLHFNNTSHQFEHTGIFFVRDICAHFAHWKELLYKSDSVDRRVLQGFNCVVWSPIMGVWIENDDRQSYLF